MSVHNTPPPYSNIAGIAKALNNHVQNCTIQNYDGNARPGELVVDMITFDLYVGNDDGNLLPIGGGSGNGVPGGSNTQVQFNQNGNFGGNSRFTFNPATSTLTVLGPISAGGNVLPATSNTYSLGSVTQQWLDLWVSGNTIYIGGIPLSIANSTLQVGGNAVVTVSSANGETNVTTLNVSGDLGAASASVTGNVTADYFIGNGSLLTGLSSSYSNAEAASFLANFGSNVISTTGDVTANSFIGDGSQLTGLPASYSNADVALFMSDFGSNVISTTGDVTANSFIGDGSQLTGLPASYSNAESASFLANFGSNVISTTGDVTANSFIGDGSQLTGLPASYSNAESASFLANLGSNVISTTGDVTANSFIGDGSQLTGIPAGYANANVAAFLPTYSGNLTASNISTSGNVEGFDGVFVNTVTANLFVGEFQGNITGNLVVPGSNTQVLFNNNGNAGADIGFTYNSATQIANISNGLNVGNTISAGVVSVTGDVTANSFIGDGSQLTGLPASYSNADVALFMSDFGSNVISTTGDVTANSFIGDGSQLTGLPASYGNSNVAAYLPTYDGSLESLTGNVTTTANVSANHFIGNGSLLTDLPPPVTSLDDTTVGRIDVMIYDGNIKYTSNVTIEPSSGNLNVSNINASVMYVAEGISATVPSSSPAPYLTGFDTVSALNIVGSNSIIGTRIGNSSSYLYGDGGNIDNINAANVVGAYGNSNVADYLPTYSGNLESLTGNVNTTANISASYFIGDGSQLTGLPAGYTNTDVAIFMADFGSNVINSTGDVTANSFIGDGSQLTNLPIDYTNANVASFLANLGSNVISTTGDVTANSFIGDGSQLTGLPVAYSNAEVAAFMADFGANTISTTGNVTATNFIGDGSQLTNVEGLYGDSNVSAYLAGGTNTGGFGTSGDITANNITALDALLYGNLNATGSVSANSFIGDGSQLTGVYANANVSAFLPTYSGTIGASNVTATGTVTGGEFVGNGAGLSNIQYSNIDGSYSNTNVSSYLPVYNGPVLSNGLSMTGNINSGNIVVGVGGIIELASGGTIFSIANGGLVGTVEVNSMNDRGISVTAGGPTAGSSYAQIQWVQDILDYDPYSAANAITNWVYVQNDGIYLENIDNVNSPGYDYLWKFGTDGNLAIPGNVSGAGNVDIGSHYFIGNGASLTGLPATYSNTDVASYLASGSLSTDIVTSANVSADDATFANTVTAALFIGNFEGNISGNLVVPGVNTQVLFNNLGNAGADSGFTYNKASQTMFVANTISGGNISVTGSAVADTLIATTVTAANLSAGTGNLLINENTILSNSALITIDPAGDGSPATGDLTVLGNLSVTGNLTYVDVSSSQTSNLQWIAAASAVTPGDATGGGLVVGNASANTAFASFTYNAIANAWLSNIAIVAQGGINVNGPLSGATTGSFSGVVTASDFVGSGATLSSLTGSNVIGDVPSATVAATVTTAAQPNITSVGNLTSLVVDGTTVLNTASANSVSLLGNVTSDGIVTNNITANYVFGTAFVGDGSQLTNLSAGTLIVNGTSSVSIGSANSNVTVTVANAQIASFTDSQLSMGLGAGATNQLANSIAIGVNAGPLNQQANAIAIGTDSAVSSQGENSIAIGSQAGGTNQGANSVAIGSGAQTSYSAVVLNASGSQLSAADAGFFVAPVRNDVANIVNVIYYNTSSKELTYGPPGSSYSDSNVVAFLASGSNSLISTTGDVIATAFIGNGAGISSLTGANVIGTVGNATHATLADNATTAVTASNATVAVTAGTVTTAAQPNITSVGNLTSLNVSGAISSTGNISGSYFIGNGSLLSNVDGIANGTSNINVAANGNITGVVAGSNVLTLGSSTVSIGVLAGNSSQGLNTVAIGANAAFLSQGGNSVAIGFNAASYAQGANCIAIGTAGRSLQGSNSIAIGLNSGNLLQGGNCVAIGVSAGANSQGSNSIAIGYLAGNTSQVGNSIIINASGTELNGTNSGFYVSPVRNDTGNVNNVVYFNTSTKELTYASASVLPDIQSNSLSGISSTQAISMYNYKDVVYPLAYSATLTPNPFNGSIQTVTLTGNVTLNGFGGTPQAGQSMTIKVQQDAVGNRVLTSTMLWAGGTKVLSTTANAIDLISIWFDGTTYYASLSKGYQ